MKQEVERIVNAVVQAPVLLVACDFDGTLAPIVIDHTAAAPDEAAFSAFRSLDHIPSTHTAIISGRGLADLRSRVGAATRARFAGSHGAEVDGATAPRLSDQTLAELGALAACLRLIAESAPGSSVEIKPRAVAFHYRAVTDADAPNAVGAVTALKSDFPTLALRLGHLVLEFVADTTNKGDALRAIRQRVGATAVLFIGDDLTDEQAFASLGPGDAGVKVGPGDTRAAFRVASIPEVAEVLEYLGVARANWSAARNLTPIQDHAVLSDQRTMALATPDGRITWLCVPRIDSSAIFAELLGGPAAGFFEIAPAEASGPGTQNYVGESLVLRTSWPGCTVTDYLDCAGGRAFQRAGRSDLVRVVEGHARVRVRFAPRLDFGRIPTLLSAHDGVLEVEGARDPLVLYAPSVSWTIVADGRHHTAEAELDLAAGPVSFELRYGSANPRPHPRPEAERRADTQRFWSAWTATLRTPDLHPDLVRRSALMLRALGHGPTGAIAAAGTTSLPEHLGGVRNWDYRYCWPRDAALAAAALLRLGNTGTAMRLLDWLLGVVDRCESPDRLRPIYTVNGSDLGPEAEIGSLAGYGDSRPVRIGNAAAQQVQLDVFGPIVDLVAMLAERGAPISPDHWRLTRAMVAAVEARWHEPDHGIWEIRGPTRHHVHSKSMCFLTIDRALVVHESVMGKPNHAWITLRDQIRADVLAHGFSEKAGAFVSYYGSTELDAAALHVGLTGLVDHRDPRWARTVDAIDAGLRRGPVVQRYLFDDGLPGPEGGFHICTGWLIESLISLGRIDQARALFEQFVALAGPTGIFAEQYDAAERMALGNFPQAYSHLALINAAVALHARDLVSAPSAGAKP